MSPNDQAYSLEMPDGSKLEVVIPREALHAQRSLSKSEGRKILKSVGSVQDYLMQWLRRKREAFREVTGPKDMQRLEARLRVRIFNAPPKTDVDLDAMIQSLIAKQANPALRSQTVQLLKVSPSLFFHGDSRALVMAALRLALEEQDEAFFINIGAAFARARKSCKLPPRPPPSGLDTWPEVLHFIASRWIPSEADAPHLCMFTDEAVGELLAVVLDDPDKDWLSIARKTRQRYKLRQASRKVIREVKVELGKSGRPRKIVLLPRRRSFHR